MAPLSAGSKGLIRDINNSRVLAIIQSRGAVSRSEIAKAADLQPPTVTQIVARFISAGLVQEMREDGIRPKPGHDVAGDDIPNLGRPPILLTLNTRAAFAVGVKLQPDGFTLALTDLSGALVDHRKRRLIGSSPDGVLQEVAGEVLLSLEQARLVGDTVLGLGIGMPGLIDHARGICRYSSLLGWTDVDVRGMLEALLDLPVYADNDVNMLTAAEIAFGAGQDVGDFLTVTIGRGIGLGIVVRNEIYRGAFGGAGEFGHVKTGSRRKCECGAVGCIEAVASEDALCQQIAAAHGLQTIALEDGLALAAEGDPYAVSIFRSGGAALGRAIGNLVNLFNPQRVVITGEGMRMGGLFLDPMLTAIKKATFGLLGGDVGIVVQEWGDEAWSQGAASIVIHEMLKPPIYETDMEHPLDRILGRGSTENGTRRTASREGRRARNRRPAAERRWEQRQSERISAL